MNMDCQDNETFLDMGFIAHVAYYFKVFICEVLVVNS